MIIALIIAAGWLLPSIILVWVVLRQDFKDLEYSDYDFTLKDAFLTLMGVLGGWITVFIYVIENGDDIVIFSVKKNPLKSDDISSLSH